MGAIWRTMRSRIVAMEVSPSRGYRGPTAVERTTRGCTSRFAFRWEMLSSCRDSHPRAHHSSLAVRYGGWISPDLDGLRSTAYFVLITIYPHRGILLIVAVRRPWCATASERQDIASALRVQSIKAYGCGGRVGYGGDLRHSRL